MFEISEELQEFRETVRRMAEEVLLPRALDLDNRGEFPRDLLPSLASLGIIGTTADRNVGGSAMGYVAGLVAAEEISRVYPSWPSFWKARRPVHALEHYGNDIQRNRYLAPIIRGKQIV